MHETARKVLDVVAVEVDVEVVVVVTKVHCPCTHCPDVAPFEQAVPSTATGPA